MSDKEEKKKKSGFIGIIIVGIIMPLVGWILGIIALVKAKKNPQEKKVAVSLIIISTIAFIIWIPILKSCDSSPSGTNESAVVALVKSGTLNNFPSMTVGEAIDNFFGNPKWSYTTKDENGLEYVTVKGKITYMDKKVTATLQFQVNQNTGSFIPFALEFNDVPQSQMLIMSLLTKMYE